MARQEDRLTHTISVGKMAGPKKPREAGVIGQVFKEGWEKWVLIRGLSCLF